jgi:tripartite-type tricarboxylate transporter receptor subunit TctC
MTLNLTRRQSLSVGVATAVTLAAPTVKAQAWPNKPITWLNPFPAGGGTDAFARPLSARLTRSLGQQVVIDNRGGAGGTVGAAIAAKAPPDGYTWFVGAVHHSIAPSMYPKLEYDLERDFIPVMGIAKVPQVIVVNPAKVQATNYKDFFEFVRRNPGRLNYGSAGNGTAHHLAGELFKTLTKTFITHIPYRGAGPAMQDLLAGSVDLMFDGMGTSSPQIRGNRLRPLMLSNDKRVPQFPDLPTNRELGLPGWDVSTWYGVWAVKGTPRELVMRMHDELTKAIQSDEIKTAWTTNVAESMLSTPEQFGQFVSSEIKKWAGVVKASGAKLD